MVTTINSMSSYGEGKIYGIYPKDLSSNILDLNFTRACEKSRINKQGVLQKVPYNLFSYSEEFDNNYWIKNNTAVTTNAHANPLSNTLTADLVYTTSSTAYINTTVNVPESHTYYFSVYAKPNNKNFIVLNGNLNNNGVWFDIQNGLVLTQSEGTGIILRESNGWFRCIWTGTLTSNATPSIRIVDADNSITNTANGTDGVYLFGAQFSKATTLEAYLKTTDRLNVPSINFSTTTSAGSTLMEPSRTNLILNSNVLVNQSVTVTNVPYTLSFYGTGTVNLSNAHTQQVTGSSGRTVVTFTPSAGTLSISVTGTVKNAQLEQGSYVTSYIETFGTAVTRLEDAFEKSGFFETVNNISGGSWYVEFENNKSYTQDVADIGLFLGSTSTGTTNSFCIDVGSNGRLAVSGYSSGVKTTYVNTFEDNIKLLITWQGNKSFSIYVNGSCIYTGTIGDINFDFLKLSTKDVPRYIKSMFLSPTAYTLKEAVNLTLLDEPYDSSYQAVLTYATSLGYALPSLGQQKLQNRFLKHLKNYGIWDKLDLLYVFASNGDSNFIRLNWKNPGVSTYIYTSSGVQAVNLGVNFVTSISTPPGVSLVNNNYQLDNASAYLYLHSFTSGNYPMAGTNNWTRLSIRANTIGDIRINNAGPTAAFSNPSTAAPAMRSVQRDSATTIHYTQQFSVESKTSTSATNLPTNFTIGASSVMIASLVSWGASLINENTVYVNLFESYKNSLI